MILRRRLSPFLWLCLMGGLAIFSSTMSKNPALPLFIRSLGVEERTLGFIAAVLFAVAGRGANHRGVNHRGAEGS